MDDTDFDLLCEDLSADEAKAISEDAGRME